MKKFLPSALCATFFFFSFSLSFASDLHPGFPRFTGRRILFAAPAEHRDTASAVTFKPALKICSCQVLELESTNHHHRNYALFAEKSNGRNLVADMTRISRVMTKEKKHMQAFFYDKLTVVHVFTEASDCRSMYTRLKTKNRSLVMYDILNVDVRR